MQSKSKNPVCFCGWRELSEMITALSVTSSLQFLQNQGFQVILMALTKHQIPLIPSIVKVLERFSQNPQIIKTFFFNLSRKTNSYGQIFIIKLLSHFLSQKNCWDTLGVQLIGLIYGYISNVKTSENVKIAVLQTLSIFTEIYQQNQNEFILDVIRKIIDTVYQQLSHSLFNPTSQTVFRDARQTKKCISDIMSIIDSVKDVIEIKNDIPNEEPTFLPKSPNIKIPVSNSWLPPSNFHSFSPILAKQRLNRRAPVIRKSSPVTTPIISLFNPE